MGVSDHHADEHDAPDAADARNSAVTRRAARLGASLSSQASRRGGCGGCRGDGAARGGALRRVTEFGLGMGPSTIDEYRVVSTEGRYVPIGYARYTPPLVDVYDYVYPTVAGWRVAVPRALERHRQVALLQRIYRYGPASAGYVRLGDTLVPAILGPGDRMTLAQSTVGLDNMPLSP